MYEEYESSNIQKTFKLSEDNIKRIQQVIKDIGIVEISTECADEVTRTFKDIDELLGYENTKSSSIAGLSFRVKSDDYNQRINISFSNSSYSTIRISVENTDGKIDHILNPLLDIIYGTRAWYGMLYRIDFVYLGIVVLFTLFAYAFIGHAFDWFPKSPKAVEYNQSELSRLWIKTFGVFLLFPAFGFALNFIRNKLFPKTVFMIGQGKQRYEFIEKVQWLTIAAFIPIFIGVII